MRNAVNTSGILLAMLLVFLTACAPDYTRSVESSRPEGGAHPFVVPVESGDQLVLELNDGDVIYGDFVGFSDTALCLSNCSIRNRLHFYSPRGFAQIPFDDIKEIWISDRTHSHTLSTGIAVGLLLPLLYLWGR